MQWQIDQETINAERRAFEAHYKHLDFKREDKGWSTGLYVHSHVAALWEGWLNSAKRFYRGQRPKGDLTIVSADRTD